MYIPNLTKFYRTDSELSAGNGRTDDAKMVIFGIKMAAKRRKTIQLEKKKRVLDIVS